jgi:predicted ATPase/class 3 adenylate cyclase
MRGAFPSGTVTFLFTDVEGSTKLLHELGAEGYGEALAEHRRILREAFGSHGGVEVDTQGDAFFVAFPTARGALEAAAEALEGLAPGPLRVRMGIHTGTPLLSEEGYVGNDVHRAARIAAAGHGGQVLISQSARSLLEPSNTVLLVDLGLHRLKDLSAPERIYQLGYGEFPPLRTLNATNLPVAANPLIGREGELTELMSLLRDSARLVTVTGPGGTGKTRFALQGAAELVDEFVDGVFWVSLQALSDPRLVIPAVAQTLGAGDDLAGHLRARRTLLLLDNLEHLLAAAPELAELLATCADLRLLVTSRAPLRIAGEHELPLDPLPDREARTLFVERARDVGRRLDPDETVAAICRRLDNLPLALELAAARTKLLDAPSLLARLEHSLPVLTGGRRDAPERQQTLRATIEWSYELLDEEAKRLFARLAVFAGSFSLEAAEEICDADLDALAALVELSLLKPVGEGRFLMLETIGEYARERLAASDESEALRSRHAEHFLALIPQLHSPGRPVADQDDDFGLAATTWGEALDYLEVDYHNVRRALEWLGVTGEVERELRLAHALVPSFLNVRGRAAEVRPMLEGILSRAGDVDPALRADALSTLAIYAPDLDREARRQFAADGLGLARTLDDKPRIQRALRTLARFQEERSERRRMLLECEALARELDDPWALGFAQRFLGELALEDGDYEQARLRLEDDLAIFERLGSELEVAQSLIMLGFLALLDDRHEDSRRLFGRSLRSVLELGITNLASECFDGFAAVALSEGDAERATRLLAVAVASREDKQNEIVEDYQRPILERTEAASRERLGDRFEVEWEAGKALTLDEGAALALGEANLGRAEGVG